MTSCQSITTAPRDGTPIIGRDVSGNERVCYPAGNGWECWAGYECEMVAFVPVVWWPIPW